MKTINDLRLSKLPTNGSLKLEDNDFVGKQFQDGSYFSTTNFIFKIKTNDGKNFVLHLPISAFNMSSLAGRKDSKYTVLFAREQDPEKDKVQILEILDRDEITSELIQNHKPDIQMKVNGTDASFFWYLFEQKPRRLRP